MSSSEVSQHLPVGKLLARALCLGLCLVYFFNNVAFAHKPEANFWSERRKAIESRHPERSEGSIDSSAPPQNDKTLLASLPAGLQLPPPALLPHPQPFSLKGEGGPLPLPLGRGTQGEGEIASLLQSLPALYGSVRNISIPSQSRHSRMPSAGIQVLDPCSRGDGRHPVVVHIQDVHMNPEAQQNIGKALQELINQKKVDLVALEGAFDPIDLSGFRRFPHQDTIRKVADYLLKENKISGPIHSLLTSPSSVPSFIGIDDPSHYQANVEAYRQSAVHLKEYKGRWTQFDQTLEREKTVTFNRELLAFDRKTRAFHQGQVKLGEYARLLTQPSPSLRAPSPDLGRGEGAHTPSLNVFLMALNLEEHLNFSEVEQERSRLLAQLVQKLSKQQTSDLLAHSVAYRLGQIRHVEFYRYLQELCRKNGIELSQSKTQTSCPRKRVSRLDSRLRGNDGSYSAMAAYLRYVLLSDQINPEKLIQEIKQLEDEAYASLIKTEQEKKLVRESRHLELEGKLLDFSLTSQEWKEYKTNPHPPLSQREGEIDGLIHQGDLSSFESFYQEAEARDQAMVRNLLKIPLPMRERVKRSLAVAKGEGGGEGKAKVIVLVTGGFHSHGMDEKLQEAGFTTISFAPKITKVDTGSGSAYLSVFTQEKTPLEKLFQGEKLFLAPGQLTHLLDLALAMPAFLPSDDPTKVVEGILHNQATAEVLREKAANEYERDKVTVDYKGRKVVEEVEWRPSRDGPDIRTIREGQETWGMSLPSKWAFGSETIGPVWKDREFWGSLAASILLMVIIHGSMDRTVSDVASCMTLIIGGGILRWFAKIASWFKGQPMTESRRLLRYITNVQSSAGDAHREALDELVKWAAGLGQRVAGAETLKRRLPQPKGGEPKFVVVSLNPTVNLHGRLDEEPPDGRLLVQTAGKGVVIARGLHDWTQEDPVVLGFAGGVLGDLHLAFLERDGVPSGLVRSTPGETRLWVRLSDGSREAQFTAPDPDIPTQEVDRLMSDLDRQLGRGDYLFIAGKLNDNIPGDLYARMVRLAHEKGAKTFLDTRGRGLKPAIEAAPHFVGINLSEFAEYLGLNERELRSDHQKIIQQSEQLIRRGIDLVVISMDSDGMVMTAREDDKIVSAYARPPVIRQVDPTGAGDVIKVAFAYAERAGWPSIQALRLATAASALTVEKPGPEVAHLSEAISRMGEVTIETLPKGEAPPATHAEQVAKEFAELASQKLEGSRPATETGAPQTPTPLEHKPQPSPLRLDQASLADLEQSIKSVPKSRLAEWMAQTGAGLEGHSLENFCRLLFQLYSGKTIEQYLAHVSPNDPLATRSIPPTQSPDKPWLIAVSNPVQDVWFDPSSDVDIGFATAPGGKSVNLARILTKWGGVTALNFGFVSGVAGGLFVTMLEKEGIFTGYMTPVSGETRLAIYPHNNSGDQYATRIMMKGHTIMATDVGKMMETFKKVLAQSTYVALGGSLPIGVPANLYAEFVTLANQSHKKVFVDTYGEPLKHVVEAGPYFLGTNVYELAEYLHTDVNELLDNPERVAQESIKWLDKGTQIAVITMGKKGMVLTTKIGGKLESWLAIPPDVEEISDISAGDTVKAAFVYADRHGWPLLEALRFATAAGAATVTHPGAEFATLPEALSLMSEVDVQPLFKGIDTFETRLISEQTPNPSAGTIPTPLASSKVTPGALVERSEKFQLGEWKNRLHTPSLFSLITLRDLLNRRIPGVEVWLIDSNKIKVQANVVDALGRLSSESQTLTVVVKAPEQIMVRTFKLFRELINDPLYDRTSLDESDKYQDFIRSADELAKQANPNDTPASPTEGAGGGKEGAPNLPSLPAPKTHVPIEQSQMTIKVRWSEGLHQRPAISLRTLAELIIGYFPRVEIYASNSAGRTANILYLHELFGLKILHGQSMTIIVKGATKTVSNQILSWFSQVVKEKRWNARALSGISAGKRYMELMEKIRDFSEPIQRALAATAMEDIREQKYEEARSQLEQLPPGMVWDGVTIEDHLRFLPEPPLSKAKVERPGPGAPPSAEPRGPGTTSGGLLSVAGTLIPSILVGVLGVEMSRETFLMLSLAGLVGPILWAVRKQLPSLRSQRGRTWLATILLMGTLGLGTYLLSSVWDRSAPRPLQTVQSRQQIVQTPVEALIKKYGEVRYHIFLTDLKDIEAKDPNLAGRLARIIAEIFDHLEQRAINDTRVIAQGFSMEEEGAIRLRLNENGSVRIRRGDSFIELKPEQLPLAKYVLLWRIDSHAQATGHDPFSVKELNEAIAEIEAYASHGSTWGVIIGLFAAGLLAGGFGAYLLLKNKRSTRQGSRHTSTPGAPSSSVPSVTATFFHKDMPLIRKLPPRWGRVVAFLLNLPARAVFFLAIPGQEEFHIKTAQGLGLRVNWTWGSLWSSVVIHDRNARPLKKFLIRLGPFFNMALGAMGLSVLGWSPLGIPQLSGIDVFLYYFFASHLVLGGLDVLLSPVLRRGDTWEIIQDIRKFGVGDIFRGLKQFLEFRLKSLPDSLGSHLLLFFAQAWGVEKPHERKWIQILGAVSLPFEVLLIWLGMDSFGPSILGRFLFVEVFFLANFLLGILTDTFVRSQVPLLKFFRRNLIYLPILYAIGPPFLSSFGPFSLFFFENPVFVFVVLIHFYSSLSAMWFLPHGFGSTATRPSAWYDKYFELMRKEPHITENEKQAEWRTFDKEWDEKEKEHATLGFKLKNPRLYFGVAMKLLWQEINLAWDYARIQIAARRLEGLIHLILYSDDYFLPPETTPAQKPEVLSRQDLPPEKTLDRDKTWGRFSKRRAYFYPIKLRIPHLIPAMALGNYPLTSKVVRLTYYVSALDIGHLPVDLCLTAIELCVRTESNNDFVLALENLIKGKITINFQAHGPLSPRIFGKFFFMLIASRSFHDIRIALRYLINPHVMIVTLPLRDWEINHLKDMARIVGFYGKWVEPTLSQFFRPTLQYARSIGVYDANLERFIKDVAEFFGKPPPDFVSGPHVTEWVVDESDEEDPDASSPVDTSQPPKRRLAGFPMPPDMSGMLFTLQMLKDCQELASDLSSHATRLARAVLQAVVETPGNELDLQAIMKREVRIKDEAELRGYLEWLHTLVFYKTGGGTAERALSILALEQKLAPFGTQIPRHSPAADPTGKDTGSGGMPHPMLLGWGLGPTVFVTVVAGACAVFAGMDPGWAILWGSGGLLAGFLLHEFGWHWLIGMITWAIENFVLRWPLGRLSSPTRFPKFLPSLSLHAVGIQTFTQSPVFRSIEVPAFLTGLPALAVFIAASIDSNVPMSWVLLAVPILAMNFLSALPLQRWFGSKWVPHPTDGDVLFDWLLPREKIDSLILRYLPRDLQGGWNRHRKIAKDGTFNLIDHLQMMLDFLNHPEKQEWYQRMPDRYKNLLSDPKNREFFLWFILLHDITKRTIEPERHEKDGKVWFTYPQHEEKSAEFVRADPRLAKDLPNRELLIEVIRLHGDFIGAFQGNINPVAFEAYVQKNRPGLDVHLDAHQVIDLLVVCCLLDNMGSDHPIQPQPERFRSFEKAHEEFKREKVKESPPGGLRADAGPQFQSFLPWILIGGAGLLYVAHAAGLVPDFGSYSLSGTEGTLMMVAAPVFSGFKRPGAKARTGWLRGLGKARAALWSLIFVIGLTAFSLFPSTRSHDTAAPDNRPTTVQNQQILPPHLVSALPSSNHFLVHPLRGYPDSVAAPLPRGGEGIIGGIEAGIGGVKDKVKAFAHWLSQKAAETQPVIWEGPTRLREAERIDSPFNHSDQRFWRSGDVAPEFLPRILKDSSWKSGEDADPRPTIPYAIYHEPSGAISSQFPDLLDFLNPTLPWGHAIGTWDTRTKQERQEDAVTNFAAANKGAIIPPINPGARGGSSGGTGNGSAGNNGKTSANGQNSGKSSQVNLQGSGTSQMKKPPTYAGLTSGYPPLGETQLNFERFFESGIFTPLPVEVKRVIPLPAPPTQQGFSAASAFTDPPSIAEKERPPVYKPGTMTIKNGPWTEERRFEESGPTSPLKKEEPAKAKDPNISAIKPPPQKEGQQVHQISINGRVTEISKPDPNSSTIQNGPNLIRIPSSSEPGKSPLQKEGPKAQTISINGRVTEISKPDPKKAENSLTIQNGPNVTETQPQKKGAPDDKESSRPGPNSLTIISGPNATRVNVKTGGSSSDKKGQNTLTISNSGKVTEVHYPVHPETKGNSLIIHNSLNVTETQPDSKTGKPSPQKEGQYIQQISNSGKVTEARYPVSPKTGAKSIASSVTVRNGEDVSVRNISKPEASKIKPDSAVVGHPGLNRGARYRENLNKVLLNYLSKTSAALIDAWDGHLFNGPEIHIDAEIMKLAKKGDIKIEGRSLFIRAKEGRDPAGRILAAGSEVFSFEQLMERGRIVVFDLSPDGGGARIAPVKAMYMDGPLSYFLYIGQEGSESLSRLTSTDPHEFLPKLKKIDDLLHPTQRLFYRSILKEIVKDGTKGSRLDLEKAVEERRIERQRIAVNLLRFKGVAFSQDPKDTENPFAALSAVALRQSDLDNANFRHWAGAAHPMRVEDLFFHVDDSGVVLRIEHRPKVWSAKPWTLEIAKGKEKGDPIQGGVGGVELTPDFRIIEVNKPSEVATPDDKDLLWGYRKALFEMFYLNMWDAHKRWDEIRTPYPPDPRQYRLLEDNPYLSLNPLRFGPDGALQEYELIFKCLWDSGRNTAVRLIPLGQDDKGTLLELVQDLKIYGALAHVTQREDPKKKLNLIMMDTHGNLLLPPWAQVHDYPESFVQYVLSGGLAREGYKDQILRKTFEIGKLDPERDHAMAPPESFLTDLMLMHWVRVRLAADPASNQKKFELHPYLLGPDETVRPFEESHRKLLAFSFDLFRRNGTQEILPQDHWDTLLRLISPQEFWDPEVQKLMQPPGGPNRMETTFSLLRLAYTDEILRGLLDPSSSNSWPVIDLEMPEEGASELQQYLRRFHPPEELLKRMLKHPLLDIPTPPEIYNEAIFSPGYRVPFAGLPTSNSDFDTPRNVAERLIRYGIPPDIRALTGRDRYVNQNSYNRNRHPAADSLLPGQYLGEKTGIIYGPGDLPGLLGTRTQNEFLRLWALRGVLTINGSSLLYTGSSSPYYKEYFVADPNSGYFGRQVDFGYPAALLTHDANARNLETIPKQFLADVHGGVAWKITRWEKGYQAPYPDVQKRGVAVGRVGENMLRALNTLSFSPPPVPRLNLQSGSVQTSLVPEFGLRGAYQKERLARYNDQLAQARIEVFRKGGGVVHVKAVEEPGELQKLEVKARPDKELSEYHRIYTDATKGIQRDLRIWRQGDFYYTWDGRTDGQGDGTLRKYDGYDTRQWIQNGDNKTISGSRGRLLEAWEVHYPTPPDVMNGPGHHSSHEVESPMKIEPNPGDSDQMSMGASPQSQSFLCALVGMVGISPLGNWKSWGDAFRKGWNRIQLFQLRWRRDRRKVKDLPSIWGSLGQTITDETQFNLIVDPSLVEACKIFWRKGVRTVLTSANGGNLEHGALIVIDARSLSPENRIIAEGLISDQERRTSNWRIVIPFETDTTVPELSERASQIAKSFKPQPGSREWKGGSSEPAAGPLMLAIPFLGWLRKLFPHRRAWTLLNRNGQAFEEVWRHMKENNLISPDLMDPRDWPVEEIAVRDERVNFDRNDILELAQYLRDRVRRAPILGFDNSLANKFTNDELVSAFLKHLTMEFSQKDMAELGKVFRELVTQYPIQQLDRLLVERGDIEIVRAFFDQVSIQRADWPVHWYMEHLRSIPQLIRNIQDILSRRRSTLSKEKKDEIHQHLLLGYQYRTLISVMMKRWRKDEGTGSKRFWLSRIWGIFKWPFFWAISPFLALVIQAAAEGALPESGLDHLQDRIAHVAKADSSVAVRPPSPLPQGANLLDVILKGDNLPLGLAALNNDLTSLSSEVSVDFARSASEEGARTIGRIPVEGEMAPEAIQAPLPMIPIVEVTAASYRDGVNDLAHQVSLMLGGNEASLRTQGVIAVAENEKVKAAAEELLATRVDASRLAKVSQKIKWIVREGNHGIEVKEDDLVLVSAAKVLEHARMDEHPLQPLVNLWQQGQKAGASFMVPIITPHAADWSKKKADNFVTFVLWQINGSILVDVTDRLEELHRALLATLESA